MKKTKIVRHKTKNLLHTVLLLCLMAAILGLIGWSIGGLTGLWFTLGLGLVMGLMGQSVSPKLVLKMYGARKLHPATIPWLSRIVAECSQKAGLEQPPELYYVPKRVLNAITVGTGPDAAIGITDGILRNLDEREIRGVVAHEIAHIANGDTRVMAVADVLSRLTRLMAGAGKLLLLLSIPVILLTEVTMPWLVVILLLAAPAATALLQLALSRTREFDADLNAVRITGDAGGLASALSKLERYNNNSLLRFFLPRSRSRVGSILQSHPHTDDRLERLRELGDFELEDERRDVDVFDLFRLLERGLRGERSGRGRRAGRHFFA